MSVKKTITQTKTKTKTKTVVAVALVTFSIASMAVGLYLIKKKSIYSRTSSSNFSQPSNSANQPSNDPAPSHPTDPILITDNDTEWSVSCVIDSGQAGRPEDYEDIKATFTAYAKKDGDNLKIKIKGEGKVRIAERTFSGSVERILDADCDSEWAKASDGTIGCDFKESIGQKMAVATLGMGANGGDKILQVASGFGRKTAGGRDNPNLGSEMNYILNNAQKKCLNRIYFNDTISDNTLKAEVGCDYQNATFKGYAERTGDSLKGRVVGEGTLTITGHSVIGGATSRTVNVDCDSGWQDMPTHHGYVVSCSNSEYAGSSDQLSLFVSPFDNKITLEPKFGGKTVCSDEAVME